MLYAAAGAGLVGLLIALILVFSSGGGESTSNVQATLEDAGCTFTSHEGSPVSQHVANENAQVTYNSFPPTSGRHLAQWAPWGSYPQPVPALRYVHNLEHGGIVVLYGNNVPEAQVTAVQEWVDEDPNGMLLAPLDPEDLANRANFRDKITLAAWNAEAGESGNGRLAVCGAFDEDAFTAFRDAYRGKGPERIPVEQLPPGT
jgi:hypothetical protein